MIMMNYKIDSEPEHESKKKDGTVELRALRAIRAQEAELGSGKRAIFSCPVHHGEMNDIQ